MEIQILAKQNLFMLLMRTKMENAVPGHLFHVGFTFIATSHPKQGSLIGVALAPGQDRHVNTETKASEQVTGSPHNFRGNLDTPWHTFLGAISCSGPPPPSFASPEKLIDPLCAESRVSSVRIIPAGIGFPLLPCSREPCSCPFLILPALTS